MAQKFLGKRLKWMKYDKILIHELRFLNLLVLEQNERVHMGHWRLPGVTPKKITAIDHPKSDTNLRGIIGKTSKDRSDPIANTGQN